MSLSCSYFVVHDIPPYQQSRKIVSPLPPLLAVLNLFPLILVLQTKTCDPNCHHSKVISQFWKHLLLFFPCASQLRVWHSTKRWRDWGEIERERSGGGEVGWGGGRCFPLGPVKVVLLPPMARVHLKRWLLLIWFDFCCWGSRGERGVGFKQYIMWSGPVCLAAHLWYLSHNHLIIFLDLYRHGMNETDWGLELKRCLIMNTGVTSGWLIL